MEQMTLDDYFKILDHEQKKPELKKGDIVYKIILNVIEMGVIDHFWECNKGYGYSAKRPQGGFFTFWTSNIEYDVFSEKEKAYKEAEKLKNLYKVIRVKDIRIINEKNFIRLVSDSRGRLEATVKLLDNNMVYSKKWYQYPFLEILNNEKDAEKKFEEKLYELTHDINDTVLDETDISIEMKDMYLSKTGLWSDYQYTTFNLPVLKGGDD
ncbi:MAG: hypothetical protein SA378_11485 [Sedimentibacter sp.]|uniref:hypothetical protein n=1 Tax=Sedimentibacter sp. TaxID=1960295 RepID=UPI0029811316|nr:hypothetical protein [Sedimentibacter sp.]MDW5300737.1 hypothetical protein [Sedimentibacter sp.]